MSDRFREIGPRDWDKLIRDLKELELEFGAAIAAAAILSPALAARIVELETLSAQHIGLLSAHGVSISANSLNVPNTIAAAAAAVAALAVIPIIPYGTIFDFAGPVIPSKWLACYGQEVDRVTYANLFAAIGITWGFGDGIDSFNLPDFRGSVLAGRDDMGGTPAGRFPGAIYLQSGMGEHETLLDNVHIPTTDLSGSGFTHGIPTVNDGNSYSAAVPHNNMQPTATVNKIIYTGVA